MRHRIMTAFDPFRSLRNVEDLLAERGIDIAHETIRYWWNRFGPMFAADNDSNWASVQDRFQVCFNRRPLSTLTSCDRRRSKTGTSLNTS